MFAGRIEETATGHTTDGISFPDDSVMQTGTTSYLTGRQPISAPLDGPSPSHAQPWLPCNPRFPSPIPQGAVCLVWSFARQWASSKGPNSQDRTLAATAQTTSAASSTPGAAQLQSAVCALHPARASARPAVIAPPAAQPDLQFSCRWHPPPVGRKAGLCGSTLTGYWGGIMASETHQH